MILTRTIVLIFLVFGWFSALGQLASNIRTKSFFINGKTILIDSSGVIPNSIEISGIDSADFILDYPSGVLTWKKIPPVKQIQITYRVFPFAIGYSSNRMSFDSIFYRFGISSKQLPNRSVTQKPFDFGKLTSNGSIGRTLSFGNRQDAVLNSSLNLQLNGYMGDSILINAAISDNNIPIQPDGNTQNLNEFDQVYIQFSKEKWKLSVGDQDIRQNQQYYLNFYKRLQGISYSTETNINSHVKNKILASGAVAKGKFTRNVFQGIEGNQGPYRLKGANQELFFIVLGGSERVFIDGQLMQRGEDQDYVINYNTAEITFMPNQMITKDKRIQIEFEYADRNFLNSQIYLNDKVSIGKKLVITAGYFSNTDARNSPINQSLDPYQKQFLAGAGNDIRNVFYPSAVPDTFGVGKLLYKKIDTLLATGKRDTIYIFQKNYVQGLYALSFTDLGEGMGNYILDRDIAANGKVYKWVEPDPVTGKKRGKYEPVILLVTPKKQSLYSLSLQWNATENTSLDADVAMSVYDPNRYSNSKEQEGSAARVIFKNKKILNSKKELVLRTEINAEYNNKGFKPVERLRTVEFTRDWGLDLVVLPAEEKLIRGNILLESNQAGSLDYLVGSYTRNKDFQAYRNQVNQKLEKNGWQMHNQFSWTSFKDPLQKGDFLRPSVNIDKIVPKFSNREFTFKYSLENNETRFLSSQYLTPGSFSFNTIQISTQSNPDKLDKWGLKYFTRSDALPSGKSLEYADRSQNFNINGEWMSNENHQLRFNATYRKLKVLNVQNNLSSDDVILGRVEYFVKAWRGAITGSSLYELGSGQEPRRDFTYFQVPAGQGEYAWIDYNNDGLEQINEFEVARFKDQAMYIRIFTPTSEFIRADYLNFNYNLLFDPSVAIQKSKPSYLLGLLKRVYLQTSFQGMNKNESNGKRSFNPFLNNASDTTLITSESLQSHSLSFNRQSQIWGIDLNYLQNVSKSFLSYGFESKKIRDLTLRIRSNWFRVLTLDLIAKNGQNELETPGFLNRNYLVLAKSVEPRITLTQGTKLRLQVGYRLDNKKNKAIEKAKISGVQIEGKYNLVSNTSVESKFALRNITFNGMPSSTIGYVMLDGLLPGKNFIWTTNLTKRIGAFLEVSIQYEGRRSANSGMVHLGRAQVRALL